MQNNFLPVVHFFHFKDNNLGLLFDPSGESPERQAHSMVVPNFASIIDENQYPPYISIVAKNFSENILGTTKIFLCDFFLVVDNREYIIGKYQEKVSGKTKGFIRRYHAFDKNLAQFEQEVIKKLADAFSEAWKNYTYTTHYSALAQNNTQASAVMMHNVPNQNYAISKEGKNTSFTKQLALAAILPILIVGGIAWALYAKKDASNLTVQRSVAEMMDANKMAQEQVDATKSTLQQMGFDGGRTADVGCFAPK
jgi:hypothetical protein